MDKRRRCRVGSLAAALVLAAGCGAQEHGPMSVEASLRPAVDPLPEAQEPALEAAALSDVASPPECVSGLSVSSVSGAGRIVILRDRSTWEVDQIDRIDTRDWSRAERISVCGRKMTNLTRSERVAVARVPVGP